LSWNINLPPAEWFAPGDRRLESVIAEVLDQDHCAIDTETTGLNIIKDIPLYWSLSWGKRRVCMPASTLPYFKEAFADRTKRWIFANAKYDAHILANVDIQVAGDLVDVAVMHSLLKEEESHKLKDMAHSVLGWTWTDFKETFGMKKGETPGDALMRMEHEDLPKLVEYASNDAYGTLELYNVFLKQLEAANTWSLWPGQYKTLANLFFRVEVPFTKVLWKCERNGIYVDCDYLKAIENPVRAEIGKIEREINQLAGRILNPNSPAQLRKYFIDDLRLKPRTMTKGGKSGIKEASIDAGFLEYYAERGQAMAKLMLRHRDLAKTLGTYVLGLQQRVDANNRVHTHFNQDVARTGRLSSSDPNLQNVKRPDEDEFKLRGAFQATPGNELIVGDYEQLEMRLLAAGSLEQSMIQLFLDGKDIHMGNAAMIFGPIYEKRHGWRMTYEDVVEAKSVEKKVKAGKLPPEAMTERVLLALAARQSAKTLGFGVVYGMRGRRLSRALGITYEEAEAQIEAFYDTYPAIKGFFDESISIVRDHGYSFTLLGRRRYHPEIHSDDNMERWGAERQANNNGIQGTAADAAKLAMIKIDRLKLDEKFGARMLLQVHDELVFECPKETAAEARDTIRCEMEHPFPSDLAVPLSVSIGVGASWIDAK
jgi:DNA polymerase I